MQLDLRPCVQRREKVALIRRRNDGENGNPALHRSTMMGWRARGLALATLREVSARFRVWPMQPIGEALLRQPMLRTQTQALRENAAAD